MFRGSVFDRWGYRPKEDKDVDNDRATRRQRSVRKDGEYVDGPFLIVGTLFEHVPTNRLHNCTPEIVQTLNRIDNFP